MPSELPNPTRRGHKVDQSNLPQTPTPAPPAAAPIQTPDPGDTNNSKMVLWFILGLLVIILTVAGIYWYLSKQTAKPQTPQSSNQEAAVSENLDQELNSIDVQAVDNDFKEVDADLENL